MGFSSFLSVVRHDLTGWKGPREFQKETWVTVGLLTLAVWWLCEAVLAIYRLYFHPLAKFPGVRAACLSDKWHYELTKGGFPEKTFEELHKKYRSKALRIRPNEIHITDIHLYKVIYDQKYTYLKSAAFYDGFRAPHSLFAEPDPALHKVRRKLLNPLFSHAGVFKLEPVIHDKIGMLTRKIHRLCKTQPINVYDAFRCLTAEIISEFAFGRSAGLIEESPNSFEADFMRSFEVAARSISPGQYYPNLRRFQTLIPLSFVKRLSAEMKSISLIIDFVDASLSHYEKNGNNTSHPIVFDQLTTISDPQKKAEAANILIAGFDTTASSLTTGIIQILSHPEIERKLVEALKNTGSSNSVIPSLLELEKIDYLMNCVKESIRLGMGVPGRLPRIVPEDRAKPLVVDGKVVPPGTIVSMSAYTMNTCEEIWGPDALSFIPERWTGDGAKGLDQYMCSFSKGARMCIGINVAQAEITIALGYLFSNFKISLPPDFKSPGVQDLFTIIYEEPGVSMHFKSL